MKKLIRSVIPCLTRNLFLILPALFFQIIFSAILHSADMRLTGATSYKLANSKSAYCWSGSKIVYTCNRTAERLGNDDVWIMNSSGTNEQPLTKSKGSETAAVFSKDGNYIYYINLTDGIYYIMRMNSDGFGKKTIYSSAFGSVIYSFELSPDGTKVAFNMNGSLYCINTDGTNLTALTTASYSGWDTYDWSFDSSKIIYGAAVGIRSIKPDNTGDTQIVASGNSPDCHPSRNIVLYQKYTSTETLNDIYTVKEDGTDVKQLTGALEGTKEVLWESDPLWSRDGRKICYEKQDAADSPYSSMWIMFYDGTEPTESQVWGYGYGSANWSPDSNSVIFICGMDIIITKSTDGLLYGTDTAETEKLTNKELLSEEQLPVGRNDNPYWSGDGKRIAYFADHPIIDKDRIMIMDENGDNKKIVIKGEDLASESMKWWSAPICWAPHNSKILFSVTKQIAEAYITNIYSVDAYEDAKDTIFNITRSTYALTNGSPQWSPDLKSIAYTVYDSSAGFQNIYIMDYSGVGKTNLTNAAKNQYYYYFDWSPDSSKIAYQGSGGIWTANYIGESKTKLTINSEYDPKWSPDGTKIAYNRWGSIYTMNSNGSSQTLLVAGSSHKWSPDGTKIAYLNGTLNVINADGTNNKILTSFAVSEFVWDDNNTLYCESIGGIIYRIDLTSNSSEAVTSSSLRSNLGPASPKTGRVLFTASDNVWILTYKNPQTFPAGEKFVIGNNYFNPVQGGSCMFYLNQNITNPEIKIYTLSGVPVRKIENIANNEFNWNGTNESEQTVASGLYIVYLTSDQGTEVKKVIVWK